MKMKKDTLFTKLMIAFSLILLILVIMSGTGSGIVSDLFFAGALFIRIFSSSTPYASIGLKIGGGIIAILFTFSLWAMSLIYAINVFEKKKLNFKEYDLTDKLFFGASLMDMFFDMVEAYIFSSQGISNLPLPSWIQFVLQAFVLISVGGFSFLGDRLPLFGFRSVDKLIRKIQDLDIFQKKTVLVKDLSSDSPSQVVEKPRYQQKTQFRSEKQVVASRNTKPKRKKSDPGLISRLLGRINPELGPQISETTYLNGAKSSAGFRDE